MPRTSEEIFSDQCSDDHSPGLMALVGYSDSEGSEDESTKPSGINEKSAQTDRTETRKIKFSLPAVTNAEPAVTDRPSKRARTGGATLSFNELLPAPKRNAETAKPKGLGSNFALKTSSHAGFSREPMETTIVEESKLIEEKSSPFKNALESSVAEPVKITGNAMRFKPLSVANSKKKPKIPASSMIQKSTTIPAKSVARSDVADKEAQPDMSNSRPPISLFSMQSTETYDVTDDKTNEYEPLLFNTQDPEQIIEEELISHEIPQMQHDPNSVNGVSANLNLSKPDQRRLFGRKVRDGAEAINITNFNMDQEYARNEELRASGAAIQHRSVKAIAPGKHSLQQLINSANNQKDALEDAWAEGRRAKGESGNKYGW